MAEHKENKAALIYSGVRLDVKGEGKEHNTVEVLNLCTHFGLNKSLKNEFGYPAVRFTNSQMAPTVFS